MPNTAEDLTHNVIEFDTSRLYQPPKSPEPPNPILDAPADYIPPPDAVLNREPEKPKRQRKAKKTGNPVGRPRGRRSDKDIEAGPDRLAQISAARAPVADAAPASPSNHVAGAAPVPSAWMASVLNSAGGSAPRRSSTLSLGDRLWLIGVGLIIAGAIVASAYFVGVIRVQ